MKGVIIDEEKQKQLRNIAKQTKRQLTLQNKKKKLSEQIPEAPTMLSLMELSQKTNLTYTLLRKLIVENGFVPYIRVGRKYLVNYDLFLEKLKKEV